MNPALAMPDEGMTLDELSNFVAEQLKRLNMVLKNIDGLNIVDIKFELQGRAYIQLNRKGLTFFDGTDFSLVTDINGNVTLKGTVTASTVIGSEIMTAEPGVYPSIVLSSVGKLLAAYKTATDSLVINPDYFGSPNIVCDNGTTTGTFGITGAYYTLYCVLGKMLIQSNNDIEIVSSGQVKFDAWSKIYSKGNLETLQNALDDLQDQIDNTGSTGGGSTIVTANLTPNRAVISNGSGKIAVSPTTSTELGYVSGATSSIQTQLNVKASVASGGKVMQTGTFTPTGMTSNNTATFTITFPTPFTTAPVVTASMAGSFINRGDFVSPQSATNTQFTLFVNYQDVANGKTVTWIAVGS